MRKDLDFLSMSRVLNVYLLSAHFELLLRRLGRYATAKLFQSLGNLLLL